jgi:hypothetical protein
MIMSDSVTGFKVQGFTVALVTDVGSQPSVLVEQTQTDSAGTFLFSTITGKRYNLTVMNTNGDVVSERQWVSSTDAVYYYDLFTGQILPIDIRVGGVDLNLFYPAPNQSVLYQNGSGGYGIRYKLNIFNQLPVYSIKTEVIQSGVIIHSDINTPTFPATTFYNGQVFDFNFMVTSTGKPIGIIVTLITANGTITQNFYYTISANQSTISPIMSREWIQQHIGEMGGFLIWFFIFILISATFRFAIQTGLDNNGMTFMLIVWAIVGAYIGLIDVVGAGIAMLSGFALWVVRRGGI